MGYSLLNQYSLALGDFETSKYDDWSDTVGKGDSKETKTFESDYDVYIWGLFLFATLLSNIVVINCMVAIACDTYDRVASENREVVILEKKAAFLADYVWDSVFLCRPCVGVK